GPFELSGRHYGQVTIEAPFSYADPSERLRKVKGFKDWSRYQGKKPYDKMRAARLLASALLEGTLVVSEAKRVSYPYALHSEQAKSRLRAVIAGSSPILRRLFNRWLLTEKAARRIRDRSDQTEALVRQAAQNGKVRRARAEIES